MTNSSQDDASADILAAIATLLEHAAQQARAAAELAGPRSPIYLTATDLELAAAATAAMLQAELPADRTRPLEHDPRRLVLAAEQLTRLIEPQHQPEGLPALVVRLCGLARDLTPAPL
jgi:hypothetical protein